MSNRIRNYILERKFIEKHIGAIHNYSLLEKEKKQYGILDPYRYDIYLGGKEDKNELLSLIDTIPDKEKKFLAIDKKMESIKRNISDGKHIYLVKQNRKIVGFLRESGRPNNGAMIEEIFISPQMRGRGIAYDLIKNYMIPKFKYLEAKTFSDNSSICKVLKKCGGVIYKKSPKGNIYYWKVE